MMMMMAFQVMMAERKYSHRTQKKYLQHARINHLARSNVIGRMVVSYLETIRTWHHRKMKGGVCVF